MEEHIFVQQQSLITAPADEKIEVVRSADSNQSSCVRRFLAKLRELRELDTQRYVDMLVGDDVEVPSDHLEQAAALKRVRDKIQTQAKWLKYLAILFLATTAIYFIARIYAIIVFLPAEKDIEKDKHFEFAYQIHMLNIFHSACFLVIALFIYRMATRSYLIFHEDHYSMLLKMTFLAFMLYFLPLLGIIGLSYIHGTAGDNDDGAPSGSWLFMKWTMDCITSDAAGVPLVYTITLHVQLFILIGAMLLISEDLHTSMEKLAQIRQASKQDQHNALELNSVMTVSNLHGQESISAQL